MLFPYSTDAPIYYWPFATVGLIIANTAAFVAALCLGPSHVEPSILHWGEGLHPVQWVTSTFLHADLFHLLGNMLFLWGFGLVVEGKLGWWRFLLAYLLIGTLESAVEQTIMLGASEGGSLGASAAIFGIMAMALVWAPKNELSCIIIVYFRPFEFECTILGFSGFFLVLQIILWVITIVLHGGDFSARMTSEALHLMGAGAGFALGVAMLRWKWVDCENWDIFSVIAGRHTMSPEERHEQQRRTDEWQEKLDQRRESALQQIRQVIRDGQPELAYRAHRKMAQTLDGWELSDHDFLRLIIAFHELHQWSASVEPMVEYLRGQGEHARQVRLKLAHILLEHEQRPAQALKVLGRRRPEELTDSQRGLLQKIGEKAIAQASDDPYEIVDDQW